MSASSHPSCFQCSRSSRVICVNCKRYFCLTHFCEHHQIYEDYFQDPNRSLRNFFEHSKLFESKCEQDINQWEEENINEIHRSANQVRRTLQTHLNNARSRFKEECQTLEYINSEDSHDHLINRLEKFHLEYHRALNSLRLTKSSLTETTIEIQSQYSHQEDSNLYDSPCQSDNFIPQSSLAIRVLQEPSIVVSTESFWAMGGSDQYLLLQEYESNQLSSFDRYGQRCFSVAWPSDNAVS